LLTATNERYFIGSLPIFCVISAHGFASFIKLIRQLVNK
jgi:hypothetical protein